MLHFKNNMTKKHKYLNKHLFQEERNKLKQIIMVKNHKFYHNNFVLSLRRTSSIKKGFPENLIFCAIKSVSSYFFKLKKADYKPSASSSNIFFVFFTPDEILLKDNITNKIKLKDITRIKR